MTRTLGCSQICTKRCGLDVSSSSRKQVVWPDVLSFVRQEIVLSSLQVGRCLWYFGNWIRVTTSYWVMRMCKGLWMEKLSVS